MVYDDFFYAAPPCLFRLFDMVLSVPGCVLLFRDMLHISPLYSFFLRKHEDEALPLTAEFNHRGTHFVIGDESGRVDVWSLVPLRLYVKSLDLTPDLLDTLNPPPPFTESANGNSLIEDSDAAKDKHREPQEHGWSTASLQWSRRVGGRAREGEGVCLVFVCIYP